MDPEQVTRDQAGTLRCRQCNFRYDLTRPEIIEQARLGLAEVQAAVGEAPAGRTGEQISPDVWSINAYVAHLDEAATVILRRIQAIAAQDRPELPYYDQDAAAEERGYGSIPIETSLAQLEPTVAHFVAYLEELPQSAWERVGLHRIGEVRLADVAHDMPHELLHHAGDIRHISDVQRTG